MNVNLVEISIVSIHTGGWVTTREWGSSSGPIQAEQGVEPQIVRLLRSRARRWRPLLLMAIRGSSLFALTTTHLPHIHTHKTERLGITNTTISSLWPLHLIRLDPSQGSHTAEGRICVGGRALRRFCVFPTLEGRAGVDVSCGGQLSTLVFSSSPKQRENSLPLSSFSPNNVTVIVECLIESLRQFSPPKLEYKEAW